MITIPVTEGDIPALIRSINALTAMMDRALQVGLLQPGTHETGGGQAVIVTGDQKPVTVSECIKQIIAAKKSANRSPHYLKALRLALTSFARGRETVPVASVTSEDAEKWLDGFSNPGSRKTYRAWLSVFFAFAVRRRYRKTNPVTEIENVTTERRVPLILTPPQVDTLLAACPAPILPYFVLATFSGLRPMEIVSPFRRLDWTAVSLENKTVSVIGK